MKEAEVEQGFKDCIDQRFAFVPYVKKECKKEAERDTTFYIGGILHAALFILSPDQYQKLKQYCYDKHGYDPGGVETGQMSIEDLITR